MSLPDHQKRPSAQCFLTACSGSKRRRRLTAPVSAVVPGAGTAASSSPWASMNEDLVHLIALRVLAGDLLDYVRFRAVCPHWRSSTVCPRGRGVIDPRFHPRRWMMLPEGHGLHQAHGRLRGYIRFFNLDTGKFVRVKLPVFQDHCVLDSVDGLLVMRRDQDKAIRLFHPFTGDVVDLPPLVTLPGASHPVHKLYYIGGVRTSINVSASGVVTVMLALQRMGCVAFATSRDQQWHLSTWTLNYRQPLSFQGKLYMVQSSFTREQNSYIFQVDPPQENQGVESGSSLPELKLIATIPTDKLTYPLFLTECDSQILVASYTDRSHLHMQVHRLVDLTLKKLVPVRSIGDKALFIDDRSLSVSSNAALPSVVGDTIVLPNLKNGSLAQYHLSTDTWSRAMDGSIISGPVFGPCCLIYHIYTCCRREYWNKGQLYNLKKGWKWQVKREWCLGV